MAVEVTENLLKINAKLRLLISNYSALQKENTQLKEAISNAKENQRQLIEKIESLNQKILIMQASASKMEGDEKRLFEKKIDQYIKDIDKAISVLSE
ncbi:MAG: hypothetical protein NVSMB45_01870 [Ginsengibacter sp.]